VSCVVGNAPQRRKRRVLNAALRLAPPHWLAPPSDWLRPPNQRWHIKGTCCYNPIDLFSPCGGSRYTCCCFTVSISPVLLSVFYLFCFICFTVSVLLTLFYLFYCLYFTFAASVLPVLLSLLCVSLLLLCMVWLGAKVVN